MRLLLIMLAFIMSSQLFAKCLDKLPLVTEKNQKIIICMSDDLDVTEACEKQGPDCKLIKDLKSSTLDKSKFVYNGIGTSGSKMCNALGWKVLMADLGESQVCTCLHPSGDYITCSSLEQSFESK